MTDPRLIAVETYASAWSPLSERERAERLKASVSPEVTYRDALTHVASIDALADYLAGFQQRQPGFRFTILSMLAWERDALARWQMVDPQGAAGVGGYDAFTFDADGRISSVIGYFDVPDQTLR